MPDYRMEKRAAAPIIIKGGMVAPETTKRSFLWQEGSMNGFASSVYCMS